MALQSPPTKKTKVLIEKVQILDESTGQIIVKEQSQLADFVPFTYATVSNSAGTNNSSSKYRSRNQLESYQLIEPITHKPVSQSQANKSADNSLEYVDVETFAHNKQVIILETNQSSSAPYQHHHQQQHQQSSSPNLTVNSLKQQSLINSGLSPHIVQNYSILAQEITAPLETKTLNTSNLNPETTLSSLPTSHLSLDSIAKSSSKSKQKSKTKSARLHQQEDISMNQRSNGHANSTNFFTSKSVKEAQQATCQFCGLAMLKKNIPTHIRRAHTPKEELVCLNEEQNIFTFNYLKPGQRRKRSARAYDYSLMTATISIDEDNENECIENKFITEGEEILSTDLNMLADRIKYGITQIPMSTLNKLIDILTKIEYSTQDEVCENAKSIRHMICYYLASGEDFKYKIRQVSEEICDKKKQVANLRADLKEVMTRKAQLERRIQPLVCELQRLEDQHGNMIETIGDEMNSDTEIILQHLNEASNRNVFINVNNQEENTEVI